MYLELARKYLTKARATSGGTRQYFANLCLVCLAKQGITPEDIGSTQQELIALQTKDDKNKEASNTEKIKSKQNDHAQACIKYLDQCRKATGASRQYYANLCLSAMTKYGVSFSQLKTSESELQDLQKQGFIESATNYLLEARNATGAKRKCYADLCWEYLAKAKAAPKEIGSSEDELQKMSV